MAEVLSSVSPRGLRLAVLRGFGNVQEVGWWICKNWGVSPHAVPRGLALHIQHSRLDPRNPARLMLGAAVDPHWIVPSSADPRAETQTADGLGSKVLRFAWGSPMDNWQVGLHWEFKWESLQ